jgi:hypothetical protein
LDKRYQVFVSSTFRDLRDERQQVIQALLELDCIPAGMELFPASDESQWELIRRVIDDCDYYIVVVGGRYGSVDDAGISYTEREYDYALSRGMSVLGFVHGEPEAIPAGKTELEAKGRKKLQAFRQKVQSRMCRTWRSAEELGGAVSRSIVQAMKRNPAEGWVKARHAASAEVVNDLRGQIDELQRQLAEARVRPPVSAEGLASGRDVFRLGYTTALLRKESYIDLSWDEIIAVLGPSMIQEASDAQLRQQLSRKIIDACQADRRDRVVLTEDHFQTIKVQLLALGVMQKSVKKRAVSDTETYWALTAFGEHYTMTLKAIKTGDFTKAR